MNYLNEGKEGPVVGGCHRTLSINFRIERYFNKA